MIKDKCFTGEWLEQFRKQSEHRRIDTIILEKMIYALHLVERLRANGLDFVFKGGTSLLLLLDEGNRFSIDIDIICKTNRSDLEELLNKVIESSRFTKWELDEARSYQAGVPKAHYKFHFDTRQQGSGTILLDLLIEDPIYPELVEVPVSTKWIDTEQETLVTVPTIDGITGDKLTAFAPNTIGIPYFKGEDRQSFSMEICKQLFDLSRLFERIENVELVAKSFAAFAEREIKYRRNQDQSITLTPDRVLQDVVDTCFIIARRGGDSADDKQKFSELQRGIRAFNSGYLMSGNFRIDDAMPAAARIAYLAAKLRVNDLSPIDYYEGKDIGKWIIEDPNWNALNKLRKHPDKSAFYYWCQALQILTRRGMDA